MKIGRSSCHGTFGELIQGVMEEHPFLVTLPINELISKATFIPRTTYTKVVGLNKNIKALEACNILMQMYNLQHGGKLFIESNIPIGKGMASSSADIVAAILAVADSYHLNLSEAIISKIACELEPTDGVMYDGVVAFDHINGVLFENLGKMPKFALIGMDVGGVIDTVQFNTKPKGYNEQDRRHFLEAYELVCDGIKNEDLSLICKASTISARINQKILPKPYFTEMERLANCYGGGVIVAHSGTVLGILIEPDRINMNDLYVQFSKQFGEMIENTGAKPFYFFDGDTRTEVNHLFFSDM